MTITKCDICGKEIPLVMCRVYKGGAHRLESDNGTPYDFCDNCFKDLQLFAKTHFAAAKSGTAVPLKEASE